jgi:crossover junction endodeoxyribonuclease RuvC
VRIFGVDPGSAHTGYGCIDTSGSRYQVLVCGAISPSKKRAFPEKLLEIRDGLIALLREYQPEIVAIEDIFYARNAQSALKLGHVRGVAMLAAAEAALPVVEYSPTEVKQAVVGYGRAEKKQVQAMVMLLLGLQRPPEKLDVSDALAVAICHAHSSRPADLAKVLHDNGGVGRNWRRYRPNRGGN